MTILIVNHLILLILPLAMTKEIKIESLRNQLLPLQIGDTKIIVSQHKFIHYVDLEPIYIETTKLQNLIYELDKVNTSQLPIPQQLTQHAQIMVAKTHQKIVALIPNRRLKRGLINGIGTIHKWLFGTLDADDGEQIKQAVETLNKGQHKIVEQVNLQSSIVKTLVTQVNKTISTISENQKSLLSHVNELENKVTYWTKGSYILYISQQIINNCNVILEFLDELENAITFASLNVLHNSLLSLENLQDILHELNKIYPENKLMQLKNLQSYYKLFGVKVIFENTNLIFAIYVPILQSESFTSYHLYPIPVNNQTIIPVKPILILGLNDHLMRDEVCPQIEDQFLCRGDLRPNHQDCASQMILKLEPSHCQATPLMLTTPIIEQISQKHVLALTNQLIDVHLHCDENGVTRIKIPTLFTIPEGCKINVNDSVFSMNPNYINGSQFKLPEIEAMPDLLIATNKPLILQQVPLDEIHDVQMKMNHVPVLSIDDVDPHSNIKYYLIIIIVCSCALMIIFWKPIMRLCSRCPFWKKNSRSTEPNETELRSTPSVPF